MSPPTVAVGYIQPVRASDLRIGAQTLPTFVAPPARDADGAIVATSVECAPVTLEQAHQSAIRVIAAMEKLPLTQSSVDVMNLAFALLHHENKAVTQ